MALLHTVQSNYMNDPESTSTPNKLGPRKRKSIHDKVISPVPNLISEDEDALNDEDEADYPKEHVSLTETEDSENESENEIRRYSYREKSSLNDGAAKRNSFIICAIGLICILLPCLFYSYADDSNITTGPTISELKTKFPLQSKEFWLHLQSGIADINLLNKPSVYIFLYEKNSEITLDKILKNISLYANCIVCSDCSVEPIVLKGEKLNTPQLANDYGQIINKYGPQLHEKHIMIIKNIEKVPGNVAQALHTFCDEYTPLVAKSLFLFTVKVDRFEDEPLHQVLKVLRNKWKDLESDKLEPLLTRISSTVLKIIA